MVANAGAGPEPIHPKQLTASLLAEAILFCLTIEARAAAQTIAERMSHENGACAAVTSFHRNLVTDAIKCDVMSDQPAVWTYKHAHKRVKLSKMAAAMIVGQHPDRARRMKV